MVEPVVCAASRALWASVNSRWGPALVDCDVDAVMHHRVHQLRGAALDILRVVGVVGEAGPGDEQRAAAAKVDDIHIWRRA